MDRRMMLGGKGREKRCLEEREGYKMVLEGEGEKMHA